MAIVLLCPSCRVRLSLGADRAGATVTCPRCESVISVPILVSAPPREIEYETDPEPPDSDATSDPDDLERTLRRRRKRRDRSRWWVTGVVLIAICSIGFIAIRSVIRKSASSDITGLSRFGSRELDQEGLEAVYNDLVQTKPEVTVFFEKGNLVVTPNAKSPTATKQFGIAISDYLTPARAALERDDLRRELVAAAREKKVTEAEAQRLARMAFKTSGRYLVLVVDLPGQPPTTAGMEWMQRHYNLD